MNHSDSVYLGLPTHKHIDILLQCNVVIKDYSDFTPTECSEIPFTSPQSVCCNCLYFPSSEAAESIHTLKLSVHNMSHVIVVIIMMV